MKSHDCEKRLDSLLQEYAIDHLDWPDSDDQLDDFLIEPSGADEYDGGEVCSRVTRVLDSPGDLRSMTPDDRTGASQKGLLFDIEPSPGMQPEIRKADAGRHRILLPDIVRRAYLEVCEHYSIDRLIADPDRNAAFIHACWRLGAQATQYELNHMLLNARKNKLIGKVESVSRYSIPRAEMDHYLFASEFALRMLQDQEYFRNQRYLSLDHILCDPELANQFEEVARSIVPGYSSVDYRWAALTIRKCQNRHVTGDLPVPLFERLGSRASLRPSRVDKQPGFFWLLLDRTDIYIGHAQDLREQLENLADARLDRMLPSEGLLPGIDPANMEYAIAPYPIASPSKREPMKTQLVRTREPRLNVLEKGHKVA